MDPEGVRITLEIEGAWDIPEDSRKQVGLRGDPWRAHGGDRGGTSENRIRGGAEIPGENVKGIMDMPAELGQDAQNVLGQIQRLLADPTLDAIQGSARGTPGASGPTVATC